METVIDPISFSQITGSDYLDTIVFHFDDQWNRCCYPPPLRTYLNKATKKDRSMLAKELIPIDIEYRCRTGDFKSFISYVSEFPEILEENKYVPHQMILTLFSLNWEWCKKTQKTGPQIRKYLLNNKLIKKPCDLFWKLAKIDFDYQPGCPKGSKLVYYLKLYHHMFGSIPVIPIEMIANQFLYDWKHNKRPEIEIVLLSFLHNIQDKKHYQNVLVTLIDIDMRERWKKGEPKWIEDYLVQFPKLLNPDRTIPETLILREQSLSIAIKVSSTQFRCPYCQSILNQDKVRNNCTHCGRVIPVDGIAPAIPRSIKSYQIIKALGIGGYAKVFKAWDPIHQRLVAIKVPVSSRVAWARVDRIEREVEIVSKLQDPHIVKIFDFHINENPACSFVVYQYIKGPILTGSLHAKIHGYPKLAITMATITGAVHYAHKNNIIHRDLKPGNILMDNNGHPVVSDFGLARFSHYSSHDTKTFPGQIVGTVHYMSPEQISGKDIDHRTDVYSLGVILYRFLTGRVPFGGKNFFQLRQQICLTKPVPPCLINRTIPEQLQRICLRALEKEPRNRYASAADLGNDLKRYLTGKKVVAKPAGPARRLLSWVCLNKLKTLTGALFALLLVTCTMLTFMIL